MALNSDSIRNDYPWINNEFLQDILRNKYQNSLLEVTEFETMPATAPGENYANIVIRVQMKLKNHDRDTLSAVFKLNQSRKDIAEVMDEFDLSVLENHLYQVVLKQVHELLRNVGIDTKLGADLISYSRKPPYVMLEDLKPLGFKILDKFKALDYDHLKMTLTKLAYWHASTAVLGEKDPSTVELFLNCLHTVDGSPFEEPTCRIYRRIGAEAEKWEGCKEIGQKYQKIVDINFKRGREVIVPDPEGFNVLNHGDLWHCNIMYKHNPTSGKLEDVVMVDYSVGHWGKPGMDLSYFLFSSSAKEITEEDWDNLLLHYYSVLSSTLKKLNYPKQIPRFYDIYTNFLSVGQFTCCSALMVAANLQLVEVEQAKLANLLDDTPDAEQFRNSLASSPSFRVIGEKLMKYFNRKGFLD